jgi:transposase-like protein
MNDPRLEQARRMYFTQGKTQKEIAHIIGVSERTIYNWIKRHSWDRMRQAAFQAPAMISENLCSHLVELQNSIARREPGCRYPTKEESQIIHRLIVGIEKMKKFPSLSTNMQVLETFRNYVRPFNKDFTRDCALYANLFLEENATNGYYPYQVEFGIEKVPPVAPFYDEEPEEEEKPLTVFAAEENLHPEPENSESEPLQSIEFQENNTTPTSFQAPEKTGNEPANLEVENDFPWRTWLPDLLQQRNPDQISANKPNPKRE